jgi:hypothetical protein
MHLIQPIRGGRAGIWSIIGLAIAAAPLLGSEITAAAATDRCSSELAFL